jgi:hypothetical protein
VVRLDGFAVRRDAHRHVAVAPEDFRQGAVVTASHMRHEDESHSGIGRNLPEQGLKGFNSAGGGADTHDWEISAHARTSG